MILAVKKTVFSAKFFAIFSLFSFVTGFVLIVAAQRNTERRSQASNGPYACDVACSPAAGGIGGAACIACMQAQTTPSPSVSVTPKVSPTPANDCPYAYREKCYTSMEQVDRARFNYDRSQQVACYLPGLCPPPVKQPVPLGPCPFRYGGRCYADAEDVERAEYLATKGPNDPVIEAPVPIDLN